MRYPMNRPYDSGKNAAIAGETVDSNPYRNAEPIDFIQWVHGFRDHQTFDPDCSICKGTGVRKLASDALSKELDTLRYAVSCDCNLPSDYDTL
jgi:ribosome modulation factor